MDVIGGQVHDVVLGVIVDNAYTLVSAAGLVDAGHHVCNTGGLIRLSATDGLANLDERGLVLFGWLLPLLDTCLHGGCSGHWEHNRL